LTSISEFERRTFNGERPTPNQCTAKLHGIRAFGVPHTRLAMEAARMSDTADPIRRAATAYDPGAVALSPESFLCRADDGSAVVLKRLEDDCLHQDRLHPRIRERLDKVRNAAHPRLATLRGVDRIDGVPFLVWSFVVGEPLADLENLDPAAAVSVCRSLVAAVRTLHARGLVHGAIHGRNAIRAGDGQVWVTHVSPYLYDDPAVDVAAVIDVVDAMVSPFIGRPEGGADDVIDANTALRAAAKKEGEPIFDAQLAQCTDLEQIDAALTRLIAPADAALPADADVRPAFRLGWLLTATTVAAAAVAAGVLAARRL
jgi:hypothetical protein